MPPSGHRQLLNKIVEPRMAKPDGPDSDNTPIPIRPIQRSQTGHAPQLILAAATFRGHLNRCLPAAIRTS